MKPRSLISVYPIACVGNGDSNLGQFTSLASVDSISSSVSSPASRCVSANDDQRRMSTSSSSTSFDSSPSPNQFKQILAELRSVDNEETPLPMVVEGVTISDEQLVKMTVRELNKLMQSQGHPRAAISTMKLRRRTLKNRKYALNCRVRRMTVVAELGQENASLKEQLVQKTNIINELQAQISQLLQCVNNNGQHSVNNTPVAENCDDNGTDTGNLQSNANAFRLLLERKLDERLGEERKEKEDLMGRKDNSGRSYSIDQIVGEQTSAGSAHELASGEHVLPDNIMEEGSDGGGSNANTPASTNSSPRPIIKRETRSLSESCNGSENNIAFYNEAPNFLDSYSIQQVLEGIESRSY